MAASAMAGGYASDAPHDAVIWLLWAEDTEMGKAIVRKECILVGCHAMQ
jgi:hypothetical protein